MLDMAPGTRIGFRLVSPLFSGEVGYGSLSFSFEIPATAANRARLGLPEVLLVRRISYRFAVELFYDGLPLAAGQLTLDQATAARYRASLAVDGSPLMRRLAEINLASLDVDPVVVRLPGTPTNQDVVDMQTHMLATVQSPGDWDHVFFPVRNGLAKASDGIYGSAYVNDWDEIADSFHRNYGYNPGPLIPGEGYTVAPFFKLPWLLGQMMREAGFRLDDAAGWLADQEIRSLVLYNSRLIDWVVETVDINAGGATTETNIHQDIIYPAEHLPDLPAADFLRGLRDLFGLAVMVERETVRLRSYVDVLSDATQVDWRERCVTDHAAAYAYDDPPSLRFFSAQDEGDDLVADLDGSETTLADTVPTLADLPGIAGPNEVYLVTEAQALYQWQYYDAVWQWRFFGYYRPAMVHPGSGTVEERTGIISAPADGPVDGETDVLWTPRVNQKPNSPYRLHGTANPFSPRLMWYRGLDAGGAPYGATTEEGGTYSLNWHGPAGLYETWWQDWLDTIRAAKRATVPLRISEAEAFSLDWLRRHRFRTADGEVLAWIQEIDFQLGDGGISVAVAEILIP